MLENPQGGDSGKRTRRRCYYDFSKNYPGSRYDKNKRSSTDDDLDSKRIVLKKALFSLAVISCFIFAYLVVFTIISISHEPAEGLDDIGVTSAHVNTSVSDEELLQIIRDARDAKANETTQDKTETASQTTESASQTQETQTEIYD